MKPAHVRIVCTSYVARLAAETEGIAYKEGNKQIKRRKEHRGYARYSPEGKMANQLHKHPTGAMNTHAYDRSKKRKPNTKQWQKRASEGAITHPPEDKNEQISQKGDEW